MHSTMADALAATNHAASATVEARDELSDYIHDRLDAVGAEQDVWTTDDATAIACRLQIDTALAMLRGAVVQLAAVVARQEQEAADDD